MYPALDCVGRDDEHGGWEGWRRMWFVEYMGELEVYWKTERLC